MDHKSPTPALKPSQREAAFGKSKALMEQFQTVPEDEQPSPEGKIGNYQERFPAETLPGAKASACSGTASLKLGSKVWQSKPER